MIQRIVLATLFLMLSLLGLAQQYQCQPIGSGLTSPVFTSGRGFINCELDVDILEVSGIVFDLEGDFNLGPESTVELRSGIYGTEGEIIATMNPIPTSQGTALTLNAAANRFFLNDEQVAALQANEFYIQINTSLYPNGEIRAQILPANVTSYYSDIYPSGLTHAEPSDTYGRALLYVHEDSVHITGMLSQIEGAVDTVARLYLRTGYAGLDGPVLDQLNISYDSTANLTLINSADNKFDLSIFDDSALNNGGLYLELDNLINQRAVARGQILPPAKAKYVSELRSYKTLPANNSLASGKLILLDMYNDTIRATGAFDQLESSVALDLAGGVLVYRGDQLSNGSVQIILNPNLTESNTKGVIRLDENLSLFNDESNNILRSGGMYMQVHTNQKFDGEIRGQVLPERRNYMWSYLNYLQNVSGEINNIKGYVDIGLSDNVMTMYGAIQGELPDSIDFSLSLVNGNAGTIGNELFIIPTDHETNKIVINQNANTLIIDQDTKDDLFNRGLHFHLLGTNNRTSRGQILPPAQLVHYMPLTDKQMQAPIVSQGIGMAILEQYQDTEYNISGSFKGLTSDAISMAQLYLGRYGFDGFVLGDIPLQLSSNAQSGNIPVLTERGEVSSLNLATFSDNGHYLVIGSEMHPQGELRGQGLEICDGYYSTKLSSVNIVKSSKDLGVGNLLMLRYDNELQVQGRFFNLSNKFNLFSEGGMTIRNASLYNKGEIEFLMSPQVNADSLSGVLLSGENSIFAVNNEVELLNRNNLYTVIKVQGQDEPGVRGQWRNIFENSPPAPIITQPEVRDTFLIDGFENDNLTINYEKPEINNTTTLQVSTRPDFNPLTYVYNYGFAEEINVSYQILDSLMQNNSVLEGDTIRYYYRLVHSDGSDYSLGEFQSMYLVRGLVTGAPEKYVAHMSANHVFPPEQSSAYGEISVNLIDDLLRINGEINDLLSPVMDSTALNIRFGYAGMKGDTVLTLIPDIASDSLSISINQSENSFQLSEEQIELLKSRQLYIELVTNDFDNGEVRGQIIPESDAYYYTNLLASNVNPDQYSEQGAALSIEIHGEEMIITGSYDQLNGGLDTDNEGGVHIHEGLPGMLGERLFSLIPVVESDTSGVFNAQSNTFDLTPAQLSAIGDRSWLADIHGLGIDAYMRGMITPVVKAVYRSEMAGVHHPTIMDLPVQGSIQADVSVDDELTVYGSINNLENSIGEIVLHLGSEANADSLASIAYEEDTESGIVTIESVDNQFSGAVINELDLLHRAIAIRANFDEQIGGVQGQLLGQAQQYGYAKLTGYQMIPSKGGGEVLQYFTERRNNKLNISGGASTEAQPLLVREARAGRPGSTLTTFTSDNVNGRFWYNPVTSSIDLDENTLALADDRSLLLQTDEKRGQWMPTNRYVYTALLNGIALDIPMVSSNGGYVILESHWDSTYTISGSISTDSDNINVNLASGYPGQASAEIRSLELTVSGDHFQINTQRFQENIASLLKGGRCHMLVEANGMDMLRSTLRPLSEYHYSTEINNLHPAETYEAEAKGKLNMDLAANRSYSYGSVTWDNEVSVNNDASAYATGLVYDTPNVVQDLELITAENVGIWSSAQNTIEVNQNIKEALDNQMFHIVVKDAEGDHMAKGRLLEIVNDIPDASAIGVSLPTDTIFVSNGVIETLQANWTPVIDNNDLMYKYQISLDASFDELLLERNTQDQNAIQLAYADILQELTTEGYMPGDTVELFNRAYVTDGSLDAYVNTARLQVVIFEEVIPIETFRAYLSGMQEASPVLSTGQASVNVSLQADVLTLNGSFDGLLSSYDDIAKAKIHVGLAGEEGAAIFDLNVDAGADFSSGDIRSEDNVFTLTEEQVELLRARKMYISIPSLRYPEGEMRGQILPIALNYYLVPITHSQKYGIHQHEMSTGQLVIEEYENELIISGSVSSAEESVFTMSQGLPGQNGDELMSLNSTLSDLHIFEAANNTMGLTPEIKSLLEANSIYIANESNNSQLRGQILDESRSAFYANISGLKTIPVSNSFIEGRVIGLLGKSETLSILGTCRRLEGASVAAELAFGRAGNTAIGTQIIQVEQSGNTLAIQSDLNSWDADPDIMDALLAREMAITIDTDSTNTFEARGQLLALAPLYGQAFISGGQQTEVYNFPASGIFEMEIHPKEIVLTGSVNNLPEELDEIEILQATSALEGELLRTLVWQENNGVAEVSAIDNTFGYDEAMVANLYRNRISLRAHSAQYPLGVARGLITRPVQAMMFASLSGANLTDAVDSPGIGFAQILIDEDIKLRFVAGVDFIPSQSLRFRFGNGLPGIPADNPTNFLGFQPQATFGMAFNNNQSIDYASGAITALRNGEFHVRIGRSLGNDNYDNYLRGQFLPAYDLSFNGALNGLHIQDVDESAETGKVNASLRGSTLNLVGNLTLDNVDQLYLSNNSLFEEVSEYQLVNATSGIIPYQELDLSDDVYLSALLDAEMTLVAVSGQDTIATHLMRDMNFFPANTTIDLPIDEDDITIAGDPDDVLDISWTATEDPDDVKYIWQLSTDENMDNVDMTIDLGSSTGLSFTYEQLDQLLSDTYQLELGESITFYHRVITTDGALDKYGPAASINLIRGEIVGTQDLLPNAQSIALAPNLTYNAQTRLITHMLESEEIELSVFNNAGQLLSKQIVSMQKGANEIPVAVKDVNSGLVHLVLVDEEGRSYSLPWIISR